MSGPRHTPGPWPITRTGDGKRYVVGEGLVDGPSGYEVAEVYSDDCDPDEALANARLIASAPDLYRELKSLIDHRLFRQAFPGRLQAIRAAVAKAEGR